MTFTTEDEKDIWKTIFTQAIQDGFGVEYAMEFADETLAKVKEKYGPKPVLSKREIEAIVRSGSFIKE